MANSRFQITLGEVLSYDWEKELQTSKEKKMHCYQQAMSEKALDFAAKGDKIGEKVFNFFSAIFSLCLKNSDQNNPFVPFFISPTGRSTAIEDFQENDVNIIEKLITKTQDKQAKARFSDIVFVIKKKINPYAKIAAENYLEFFKEADDKIDYTLMESLKRGFSLSAYFGREKYPFTDYVSAITKIIENRASSETKTVTERFIRMLIEMNVKKDEILKCFSISEEIAEKMEFNKEHHLAQMYYDSAIAALYLLENDAEAKRILKRKGDSFLNESNSANDQSTTGYFLASTYLSKAIECYRQAGESEVAKQLHGRLIEFQKKTIIYENIPKAPMDISAFIKTAKNNVKEKTLYDSVLAFASGHQIINKQELEKEVEKEIKDNPASHIFGVTYLSDNGQVLDRRPPLLDDDPQKREEAFEMIIFDRMRLYLQERVNAYIEPCRQIIQNEHRPSWDDLVFIVEHNPFISPGHEGVLLKGIHAGFQGDFIIAAHLLVPQIEESIRHVLRNNGCVTSTLNQKLIQEERAVGILLKLPETIEVLGEDLTFELRCLLCEKTGYNFRNLLAHGLITTNGCYSSAAYNLWWLVIKLCVFPLIMQKKN